MIIILLASVITQIAFESWRMKQEKRYGIVEGRKRLSYTPALIYLYNRQIKKCENLTVQSAHLPYYNIGLSKYVAKQIYDEYIVFCFYTDNEKKRYVKFIE